MGNPLIIQKGVSILLLTRDGPLKIKTLEDLCKIKPGVIRKAIESSATYKQGQKEYKKYCEDLKRWRKESEKSLEGIIFKAA